MCFFSVPSNEGEGKGIRNEREVASGGCSAFGTREQLLQ